MAVKYGFFDSINGDRTYNADDISNYFLKLISNGVFATPSTCMQVQALSGMTVSVAPGWGFINCKWIENDSNYSLQLDEADASMNRIDRIVLRLDRSQQARNITIEIKKGTTAVTPTPPALTRAGAVYELSLAQIAVNAGVSLITQANITDERANTEVCGWVTGLIDQLDTSELFAQFTSAFNTWFTEIKTQVQSTTIVTGYTGNYTTSSQSVSTIAVPIANFNPTLDILHVFVNGLKLTPYVDYTLSGTDILLTEPLDVLGTVVEFEVLKSNDTQEAESIATEVVYIENKVENIDNSVTVIENNVTNIEQNLTTVENSVSNLSTTVNNVTNEITTINNSVSTLNTNVTAIQTAMHGLSFMKLTQAEYDAITNPDENTVYIIVSASEEVET